MNRVEVYENKRKKNVVYRYTLDTLISYDDLECIVTSLPEQYKYSFSLSNYEEMESFIYGFENKDEILNFYQNHPKLYETEILCITEKIGDKDIIYRFDLNTNDCVISMPLGTPEYIGTLDLIEKSVMENKKKLM